MVVVEDRDIEAMVETLADRHGSAPEEALRFALRRALVSDIETLVERSRAYAKPCARSRHISIRPQPIAPSSTRFTKTEVHRCFRADRHSCG
ncbi:hypothetical protein [Rhizobium sp. CC-YZS058]|uniref:hypothetical protein n=1 Tax=Rhizobium sp. CC-YZS058 TaxID=3042153 RepID=UPI002B057C6E|nr:hypothetical protein [Rhizobium sp. CC-YZS058]MEA3535304.1 hypothetical protein [Rhizobium sp. CC-YZS058]